MSKVVAILSEVRPEFDFQVSSDLVGDGMLDSFDIVALVGRLEEEYGVVIDASDVRPENFGSVAAIEALVARASPTG